MAENIYDINKSLHENYKILYNDLTKNSDITIKGDGKIIFWILENGHIDFWYDDLIELILNKVAIMDEEIIEIARSKGIQIYDNIAIKKKSV